MPKNPVHPDIKRITALSYLRGKVQGQTNEEIATDHNVSRRTVDRVLSWAQKAGLFAQYEDTLLQSIVPHAMQAVMEACQDGDATVALEVLKGLELLPGLSKRKEKPSQPVLGTSGEDLMAYAIQLRNQAQKEEDLIEGSIEGQYAGLLIAATSESAGYAEAVEALERGNDVHAGEVPQQKSETGEESNTQQDALPPTDGNASESENPVPVGAGVGIIS